MAYNGWRNRATWNVALWLGNDEGLYMFSRRYTDYSTMAQDLLALGLEKTPDGISYTDGSLDTDALDEMLTEG